MPETQVQKIQLTGRIRLDLWPQPEQYANPFDQVKVHVLLHEAHSLENPFTQGFEVEPGKEYYIFINQKVLERLPAPYQTNCTDYLKLWKENGGNGPLTQKACREKCIVDNMLRDNGCVAPSVAYPENYTMCEDFNMQLSKDILTKCSLQCSHACREVKYGVLREEINFDLTYYCSEKDLNCKYQIVRFFFFFNQLDVEKTVHQPRFETVELFSYIGGYIGMWLGVSLVALFDFAETLLALVTYTCRNKKKMNTVHRY